MKTSRLFLTALALATFASASAGDLISVTPSNGLGKRTVRVWNDTGNPGEKATNLLLDKTIEANKTKKWCTANNNGDNLIEVMFELSDYYDIDKIVIHDCKTQENDANMTDYEIYVATEATNIGAEFGNWQLVDAKSGQGAVDIKTSEFTPTKARYIKFTSKHVPLIRVYGFEIYGTKSAQSAHPANLISVGASIMKYYDAVSLDESPFGIFDGNNENFASKWCFARALPTDSLKYVVADLGDDYEIDGLKLYDCNHLESGANIKGYNFYVSETMPDLNLVGNLEDLNTSWKKVVSAYQSDRSADNIKVDNFATPVLGRYVKFEVPYSATTGTVRLFELEIFGELKQLTSIDEDAAENQDLFVSPSIVNRGQSLTLQDEGILVVYSLSGQTAVSSLNVDAGATILTDQLAPGCYVAKLLSAKGSKQQKIIVR